MTIAATCVVGNLGFRIALDLSASRAPLRSARSRNQWPRPHALAPLPRFARAIGRVLMATALGCATGRPPARTVPPPLRSASLRAQGRANGASKAI